MTRKHLDAMFIFPRVLSIALTMVLFIFPEELFPSLANTNFFLAMLPAIVALILTLYAWSFEKNGGVIFIVQGFIMGIMNISVMTYEAIYFISSSSFLIGALFLIGHRFRKKRH